MGGWTTDGMGTVGPITVNGVAQTGNGGGLMPEIVSHATGAFDTQSPGGAQPQTVAVSAAQIAMIAVAMIQNRVTATGGAVPGGALLSGSALLTLTTAPGATQTIVLSDTQIGPNSNINFDIRSCSNPTVGMVPISVVYTANTATIVFQNQGGAALSGGSNNMVFSWHI